MAQDDGHQVCAAPTHSISTDQGCVMESLPTLNSGEDVPELPQPFPAGIKHRPLSKAASVTLLRGIQQQDVTQWA